MIRNFEKVTTKKQRNGYNEEYELGRKRIKKHAKSIKVAKRYKGIEE